MADKFRLIPLSLSSSRTIVNGPPETLAIKSGHMVLKKGESSGRHSTKDREELIIIRKGEGVLEINDAHTVVINEQVAIYIPPQTWHNVKNLTSEVLDYVYVVAPAPKIKNDKFSNFFKKVWAACQTIPRGQVATYSYLARLIGNPRAQRAVAKALAKNPYAPEVPCHRVIRQDHTLGGYSARGGPKRKKQILIAEGVQFDNRGGVLPDFVIK